MSSLTSPGLIKATNECLVKIAPETTLLRSFAYDFSNEIGEEGMTIKIPLASPGAVTSEFSDSNTLENANGTVKYATIVLNHFPKQTFEFKNTDVLEAPNAPYWTKVAEAGANAIKANMSKTFGELFTTESCKGGKVTLNGDVTLKKIAALRKECAGRVADTVLGLNADLYGQLIALLDYSVIGNQSNPFATGMIGEGVLGFANIIQINDLPDGVLGVLAPRNSVAIGSRAFPIADEGVYSEVGQVSDEYGTTLTVTRHGSASMAKGFINIVSMYGLGIVDGDAIKYISAS